MVIKKVLILLLCILSTEVMAEGMPKDKLISGLKKTMPSTLCDSESFISQCYHISPNECKEAVSSETEICINKLNNQIPDLIPSREKAIDIGGNLGKCVGYEFGLKHVDIFIFSDQCNKTLKLYSPLPTSTNQVMSPEKFMQYKSMLPDSLDIINVQMDKIASCFEKEITLNNSALCVKQTAHPIETMIQKLMPSKMDTLCIKDSNNVSHFTWSKKNHLVIINELKNEINKNKLNKECILHSNSVEEYTNCLIKSKS